VTPRVYAPSAAVACETIVLSADESHYVRHVLRLVAGANLRVFDGRGGEWDATIARAGRDAVHVVLDRRADAVAEPPVEMTLALAILKSEFMDAAIKDATMMGATTIQPLVATHSSVRQTPAGSTRLVARWQRIALASVRQCGRARLPAIETPQPVDAWIDALRGDGALKIMLVEPAAMAGPASQASPPPDLDAWGLRARERGAILLVGPEGGWTGDERSRAGAAGFAPWTISPRVLRADATPIAALAVLLYAWEMRQG
jgi:16S rRNA (uracil1498-N3)-methyltransferase